ncbi:nuclear receptor 2C2-associated protein-like [Rhopilema esculentum]|uniref:nuclear receptor 2C2-associated protein-like n=1 Tax=Rhopilema esculentum TaxID=499914 RepID=UPI0031D47AC9
MSAASESKDEDLVAKLGSDLKIRVSSVLNKNVKQYGKKFMFDGKEDTCWNSDQGQQQVIGFQSSCPVLINEIQIQFQGGFAGKECELEMQSEDGKVTTFNFYPEDINQMQIFPVPSTVLTSSFKLNFNTSTDFFGRIIIYQLKLFGKTL